MRFAQLPGDELIAHLQGVKSIAGAGILFNGEPSAAGGIGRRSPLAHCTITHVPGPSKPLYLCGARMTYFSAIMPISGGNST